jgi:hypothetical protein
MAKNKINYRKKYFVTVITSILLITILIFLSSCSSSGSESNAYIEQQHKTGFQGLEISLEDNRPPDGVLSGRNYDMSIRLVNKGAFDISDGKLSILGFDERYVGIYHAVDVNFPTDSNFLRGNEIMGFDGDQTMLSFDLFINELEEGKETEHQSYFVTASYNYYAELSETICINPGAGDISYDVHGSGCSDADSYLRIKGQGSPISVTEVEAIPSSGSEIELRITFENGGNGEAEKLTLVKANLGHESLNCEFRKGEGNSIEFDSDYDQEVELVCRKIVESSVAYPTTLFLEFTYDYTTFLEKRLTIEN